MSAEAREAIWETSTNLNLPWTKDIESRGLYAAWQLLLQLLSVFLELQHLQKERLPRVTICLQKLNQFVSSSGVLVDGLCMSL